VFFAPTVGILGLLVFVLGAILGNVYIKSQLPVKREMSKAKAPLIAHFGAAVEGLGEPMIFVDLALLIIFRSFDQSLRS
jgi:hypothetical protein